jgi:hypothetical protein
MTANDLADKLDLVRIELTIQAAAMLRQQQSEIDALKKENENLKERDRVNSLLFNQIF